MMFIANFCILSDETSKSSQQSKSWKTTARYSTAVFIINPLRTEPLDGQASLWTKGTPAALGGYMPTRVRQGLMCILKCILV